ncbi:hypothetical protein CTheo_8570 [Ceratobasidium theobromae]|uniref:Jacalin-type lectin domain-containing protein n=1 Tax=Ceratobasidium theobromae TaxID=1582974 RepID=A0A5N5Q988_9AGAM|nr:hypothetical protein CTheo_8570 [Ceratobasidium theobromae]
MAATAVLVNKRFLTAAEAVFKAAPEGSLTTATYNDHTVEKLADDALQVSASFKNSSAQLGKVDSEYSGSHWKGQWDALHAQYDRLLERVKSMSRAGAQYIDDFNTNVASKFSPEASNIEADKQLLRTWLQNNPDDRGLRVESQEISQGFLSLSDEVTSLRDRFSIFSAQKGAEFQGELADMNRNMQKLQRDIDWERSEAAQAQAALDGVVAGLSMVVGFFEALFTFGQSHKLIDEANERIQKHVRAEMDLRRRKDQVAAQARQVAVDESKLHDVHVAFSILAQDVIDISGRLGRFANMWATAHSNIIELRDFLDGNDDIDSSLVFSLKVKIINSTAAVFASEMKEFADALGGLSNPGRVAYVVSRQYGGSNLNRGELFNDARLGLDVQRSIISMTITSGWVIDGIQVTYRLKNGQTQTVSHGSIRSSGNTLILNANEYISEVYGKSGFADNREPWMGDCVQQLSIVVRNSVTGAQRTYGPFGTARGLAESATTRISWSGRLLAFAGHADNSAGQVGFHGIAFVEALADLGNPARLEYTVSRQFGGSDTTRGSLFNDATLGLDVQRPIVSVAIASGWVIDGIRVTYRLKNGQIQTVSHGSMGSSGNTLTLNDSEYISAVNGKSGVADNREPWMGDCVQQLTLVVRNSVTGAQRTFGTFGTARGLTESATTRISWAGRLLAFAGRADNSAGQVGFRGISFVEALADPGNPTRAEYIVSAQFGGSDVTRGARFNDAGEDLDVQRPIANVTITSGWVIDGIQVTYRLKDGQTHIVSHGSIRSAGNTLTLNDNEYISEVYGKSGFADNREPWMGDCVQQLTLVVRNSVTGAQRTFGPFGTARGLSESATTRISWSGRLFAFAGRADNLAGQVGMRGIAFVQRK